MYDTSRRFIIGDKIYLTHNNCTCQMRGGKVFDTYLLHIYVQNEKGGVMAS